MTMSDALLGLAGLFLLWAQNQGFRRQNDIFAITAGSEPLMPARKLSDSSLKRYWPLLAMVVLVGIQWAWFLMKNRVTAQSTDSSAAPWILGVGIALMVAHTLWTHWSDKKAIPLMLAAKRVELQGREGKQESSLTSPTHPSKLTIRSALYRALVPDAKVIDVTECLRNKIAGDSLVFEILNGNFWIGDKNLVPTDPCQGEKKWLRIEYSFDGRPHRTIERREDYFVVLPEDTFVKAEIERIQDEVKRERSQQNSDLSRAQQSRKLCDEERREAIAKAEELRAKLSLFTPLQLEALQLRADLRQFLEKVGPPPKSGLEHKLGGKEEMSPEELAQWATFQRDIVGPLQARVKATYTLNFKQTATTLYHRFVEIGRIDQQFRYLSDDAESIEQVQQLINVLWGMAGTI
jgi:hypothetical protein